MTLLEHSVELLKFFCENVVFMLKFKKGKIMRFVYDFSKKDKPQFLLVRKLIKKLCSLCHNRIFKKQFLNEF